MFKTKSLLATVIGTALLSISSLSYAQAIDTNNSCPKLSAYSYRCSTDFVNIGKMTNKKLYIVYINNESKKLDPNLSGFQDLKSGVDALISKYEGDFNLSERVEQYVVANLKGKNINLTSNDVILEELSLDELKK